MVGPACRHTFLKWHAPVGFTARVSIKHRWPATKANEEVKKEKKMSERESEGREQLRGRGNNNGEIRGKEGREGKEKKREAFKAGTHDAAGTDGMSSILQGKKKERIK